MAVTRVAGVGGGASMAPGGTTLSSEGILSVERPVAEPRCVLLAGRVLVALVLAPALRQPRASTRWGRPSMRRYSSDRSELDSSTRIASC